MTGAVLGAAFACGVLMIIVGWRAARRPSFMSRVRPYVRDVLPDLAPDAPPSPWAAIFVPPLRSAAESIGELAGSATSVRRRLRRLGDDDDVDRFRTEQLLWGAGGFVIALVASLVAASLTDTSPIALLLLCALGFVTGVLARDNYLGTQVRRREQRMIEEFPVLADLLALSVAAGETPMAGLERLVTIGSGELVNDLARVVAALRTGTTMSQALAEMGARTGVPAVARFADGLAVAIERGTPLVDVLHAQAADAREAARRDLIETGGKREIAMMVPVVFLVLPVTVIFAFFPGLIGLQMTS